MRNKQLNKYLFIFFIIIFSSINAYGTNHYIIPGGSGSRDGSDFNNAYANLPSILVRGDIYYVASGAYTLRFGSQGLGWLDTASGTGTITIKKANAMDNSGVQGWMESYGMGSAILSGTFPFYIALSNVIIDGAYRGKDWTSDYGFVINNTNANGYTNGLQIANGYNNITIKYCEIKGSKSNLSGTTNGIYMNALSQDSINNIALQYNYVHDWSQDIILTRALSNVTIDSNYLARNINDGITHGQGISNDCSHDMTVSNNVFRDIGSSGQICTGMSASCSSNNWNIYNNVFFRSADSIGLTVEGAGIRNWNGYGTRTGWHIYNNTFYRISPIFAQVMIEFPSGSTGNYAYNNLFYNCSAGGKISFLNVDNHDYNMFINQADYPSEANSQISSSDPFVNSTEYDFRLISTATAKDKGVDFSSVFTTDILGIHRPQGAAWDIGAYEYSEDSLSLPTVIETVNQVPAISFSPSSLSFSSVLPGTSSSKTVTVSNTSASSVAISSISLSGTNTNQFSIPAATDYCTGETVAASGNCSFQVIFSPTTVGEKTANVNFTALYYGNPATLPLYGSAVSYKPVPRTKLSKNK